MRKENNFDVMDKITVYISDNSKIEDIISRHKDLLLKDIMAKDVVIGEHKDDVISKVWEINDENVKIGIKK